MKDTDRFRLLFGPYRTPRFRYGSIVACERRGDVIICGTTDARIPVAHCMAAARRPAPKRGPAPCTAPLAGG
jgi:hypothetical protein